MTEEQTILDQIAGVVAWYRSLPKDYNDIQLLSTAQKKLACLLFDYAGEVGDLYKAKNATEYTRKTTFEKERLRLIGDGKSAAAAGNEAQTMIAKIAFEEFCADADYRAALMQKEAASDVLRSMLQHIASIKEERRLEFSGQGSQ